MIAEADTVMTVDEVAEYLSLHPLTVRVLARAGKIPAFKIGKQWRVKRELLARWIEEQSAVKSDEAPESGE